MLYKFDPKDSIGTLSGYLSLKPFAADKGFGKLKDKAGAYVKKWNEECRKRRDAYLNEFWYSAKEPMRCMSPWLFIYEHSYGYGMAGSPVPIKFDHLEYDLFNRTTYCSDAFISS